MAETIQPVPISTPKPVVIPPTDSEFDKTPVDVPTVDAVLLDAGDKKKVEVVNKETKILTSEYTQTEFTVVEQKAAQNLHNDFTAYLSKTGGVNPEENVKSTIPTGIDILDAILGGGVATKLTQFVGMPGSGKSALVARIIATGQRKWPGKFISVYIDSEQSMSTERLSQLGVNMPEIIPYSEDITVEKIFKTVEIMCTYKEGHPEYMDVPSCIIWDSVANTLTDKGMEEDKHTSVLGQKAALLTHLLPKYVNKLNKYNISLVCVNQLRDKIDMGMYGPPASLRFLADKNIPGGNSLLFNSFQLFYFRQKEILKGEYGFDGVTVVGKAVKNKLFTPNIDIEMVFSFEHGFSNFWTNYELLKKFKRVTAGGGWVNLAGYEGPKCQQKNVIQKYREDAKFKNVWDETVKDVIQTEYIDAHKTGDNKQTEAW